MICHISSKPPGNGKKSLAKKSLGQNFLFDPSILHRIVEVSKVTPEDTVVEIGPGYGRMTGILSGAVKKVIAIELDRDLCEKLHDEFRGFDNIELVCGDALKFDYEALGPFKVVANIPYYITTPIMFRLLKAKNLKSMTLTIQKEVAQRIVGKPNTKEYGVLSIAVQYHCRPTMEFIIPRGAFRPVPKVDSAVVHLEVFENPRVNVADEKLFFKIFRTAFSQRRKTLANALKPIYKEASSILTEAGIDPKRRAETLSIEEFAKLSEHFRDVAS